MKKNLKNYFKNLIKNEIIIGMGAGTISNWIRNLNKAYEFEHEKLKNKFGKSIIFYENLSKFSWFNLGGPAKILFKPESTRTINRISKTYKQFSQNNLWGLDQIL